MKNVTEPTVRMSTRKTIVWGSDKKNLRLFRFFKDKILNLS